MKQEQSRGFERIKNSPLVANPDRNTYLFAIGIDKYQHNVKWGELNNAAKDAQDIVDVFQENFGIEENHSFLLLNEEATRVNILERLQYLRENLNENDNLILYFSGHGDMDGEQSHGYWIPVDAKDKNHQYIPHSTVIDHIKGMQAHHVYVIADACFSGAMALRKGGGMAGKDNQASRRVFTSGEVEVVSDGNPGGNSPFTFQVLEFLRSQEESFLCSRMENYVIERVERSKPIRSVLIDQKYIKGEMVLYPAPIILKKTEEAWTKAQTEDNAEAYIAFLEKYPNSRFSEVAADELKELGILPEKYIFSKPSDRSTYIIENKRVLFISLSALILLILAVTAWWFLIEKPLRIDAELALIDQEIDDRNWDEVWERYAETTEGKKSEEHFIQSLAKLPVYASGPEFLKLSSSIEKFSPSFVDEGKKVLAFWLSYTTDWERGAKELYPTLTISDSLSLREKIHSEMKEKTRIK
ncbi:MAG: caspase family protein, partial [Bacteroidota bacterium]